MAFFFGRASSGRFTRNSFPKQNKWAAYVFIMLITMISIFIYVGGVTRHSVAYSRARSFIMQNKCINDHLGPINSIDMSPLAKFYTRNNTALFNLDIDGKKADGKIEIMLFRNGNWRVSKAMLKVQGHEWNCV